MYGAARETYAEFTVARADQMAVKPSRLTFEESAVLPYAAFPALQGLRDHGHVQPRQRVLVVGASAAVGSIAVQLAKAIGAEVTGVCGPRDVDLTHSLGAEHVADYSSQDFADGARVMT
ncbi:zinc-binding dehydrogenase [Terrabacter sp. BE26]|uniref:zinc-binding dehydrogenase n=1 Tax=Terrabacter sp. BE26 TaxID=2898152 RepID=UPI0035BE63B6